MEGKWEEGYIRKVSYSMYEMSHLCGVENGLRRVSCEVLASLFFLFFFFKIVPSLRLWFAVCFFWWKGWLKQLHTLSCFSPLMSPYRLHWYSCLYGHVGNRIRKVIWVKYNVSFFRVIFNLNRFLISFSVQHRQLYTYS